MRERPSIIRRVLPIVMTLINEQEFHVPQQFQVFGISQVEEVFRLFQSGRNSGKMVIERRDQDLVSVRSQESPDCVHLS